jgi:hypothetical protein
MTSEQLLILRQKFPHIFNQQTLEENSNLAQIFGLSFIH